MRHIHFSPCDLFQGVGHRGGFHVPKTVQKFGGTLGGTILLWRCGVNCQGHGGDTGHH